jgi:DNA replication ATP-dependent helicase Dna2
MRNISDFIEFVEKERLAQETEAQNRDLLSMRALVSLGQAISGLQIVRRSADTLQLTCSENQSRFRPGDRLIFSHELLPPFRGVLYELSEQGHRLHVRGSKLPDIEALGPWIATEYNSDLTFSVQAALKKLQPGAPGWSFVKRLLGESPLPEVKSSLAYSNLLGELLTESGLELDQSQAEAFSKCLTLPPMLGVQGPPGTGKTLLLALIAEALMRSGRRVVLLAPTHQAVNNALTTIHQIFVDRKVKKFGDELRAESLAKDIPIVTSAAKLSKEPVDTLIGLTFMSALHHLMISDQKMIAPHVVILDEAGQLPVAQGLCTGLSGAGSILMFGDDKQMPPVFSGDLSEEPLANSVFAQLRSSQPQAIQMLNTTYRLNEDLCQAIGSVFYTDSKGPPLHPSQNAADRKFPERIAAEANEESIRQTLSADTSLVWLQVTTRNCMQFNHEEAQAAAKLVATCLNSGMNSSEIAVVTPFRRQAAHIRQLIAAQVGEGQELPIVDTVERVQGLTVETVIVSFCASETDYITSIAEFLFSPHRLNVAVSRARTKAIVISSPDVFNVLPKSFNGIVSRGLCQRFLNSMNYVRLRTS